MDVLKRSEVPEEFTWNLADMFESDEAWLKEYESLKELPAKIAEFQGKLGESAENLLAFMKLSDEIEVRISMFHGYANCKGDQDTGNSKYQDFRGKATAIVVSIMSAMAFSTPEIMEISDEKMEQFYKDEPELNTYRRSIYQIRRKKEHILSKDAETILAAAGEMAEGPETIGSTFRNAELKFPSVTDSEGVEHQLTNGSFVPLLESSDVNFRKKVFETYYNRLGEYKNTIAATLDAQFKQLCFFANARKYPSTLAASLDATEVPTEVYHNLIEAVHGNLDKMYHYVSLRKKLMGLDELHMYDVYTPIVADAAEKISFEQAKKMFLKHSRFSVRIMSTSSKRASRIAGSTSTKTSANAAAHTPPAAAARTPMCC